MTTYTSINNALRKGTALVATITTDGVGRTLPVRGASKHGICVWVNTDEGAFALGTWYSTGKDYRQQIVRVSKAQAHAG